jgi:apolipoprotein N-acyltransferase
VARGYAERTGRLAAQGARVVILPEKFVGVMPGDPAGVRTMLSETARTSHITLVAGLNLIGTGPKRNVAVVFSPEGEVVAEYDKRHMLPGPESGYAAGNTPGLFDVGGMQWGVAICKDLDFPPWLRAYGRRGVRVLAVPAWDFRRDGSLHARMAVVRGVENGFTLARAAQQGLLSFSDAWGRILHARASDEEPEVMVAWDIRPGPGPTVYTRWGDWFGWFSVLCLAALVSTILYESFQRR